MMEHLTVLGILAFLLEELWLMLRFLFCLLKDFVDEDVVVETVKLVAWAGVADAFLR